MLDVGGVLAAGGARVVRGHGAPLADLKKRCNKDNNNVICNIVIIMS